jgi:putative sigma-54 modulation protein
MITLHVNGNNFEIDEKISEYLQKKIGGLDKYLPKNAKGTTGRVTLTTDPSGREDNQFVCEAMIDVPGQVIEAKEATLNMYAAIDIVSAKLKSQILKYKNKHTPSRFRGKELFRRLLGREEVTES